MACHSRLLSLRHELGLLAGSRERFHPVPWFNGNQEDGSHPSSIKTALEEKGGRQVGDFSRPVKTTLIHTEDSPASRFRLLCGGFGRRVNNYPY